MITMVDEIFDRQFQAGRADLFDGIDRGLARLAKSIAAGLAALHRIQFDAPWASERSDGGCA